MNEQQQTSQQNVETLDQPSSVQSVSSASSTFDDELTSLRTENDELKHQLRLRSARDELTRTLSSENARSPELLFEAAASKLVFDDDGKLTNLYDIITDIKSRFPEQFVVGRTGPETNGESVAINAPPAFPLSPPAINAGAGRIGIRPPLTKDTLARMKPRDIANLNWNDVKQVMES